MVGNINIVSNLPSFAGTGWQVQHQQHQQPRRHGRSARTMPVSKVPASLASLHLHLHLHPDPEALPSLPSYCVLPCHFISMAGMAGCVALMEGGRGHKEEH